MYMGIVVLVLLLCISFIAFFAASETAYLSLSKIKLRNLVQNKKRNAKTALHLRSDMDKLLTLMLIGTNFFNAASASLATAFAVSLVGQSGVGIATVAITVLVAIFGNIVPKTAAVLYPEKIALAFAPILNALEKIFFFVVWFFSQISRGVSYVASKIWQNDIDEVTEDDIKMLIQIGLHEGTLEADESKMLEKIFEFSDLTAHDIMKHRSFVKAVSADSMGNDAAALFLSSGCSCVPVYKNSLDSVIGVLDYKSVLFASSKELERGDFIVRKMANALFVPETFTALEVLALFKKVHSDFAVVLDEQGCTAGIVTMDDVMRVVFGRMTDENATSDTAPEARIKIINTSEYIVPGDMKLDDVNEIIKVHVESEAFNTLGGWLLERFGYLPNVGEVFVDGTTAYIVEDQARRRILSVRIKKGVDRIRRQIAKGEHETGS